MMLVYSCLFKLEVVYFIVINTASRYKVRPRLSRQSANKNVSGSLRLDGRMQLQQS